MSSKSTTAAVNFPTFVFRDREWQVRDDWKDWKFLVQVDQDGNAIDRCWVNPKNGKAAYFDLVPGLYSPVMRKDPDNAFKTPIDRLYRRPDGSDAFPDQQIGGIIVKSAPQGDIIARYSKTNAANTGIDLRLSDDGVLNVGEVQYHLYALVLTDKNRVFNYDAFFSPVLPTGAVTIYELETLPI